MGTRWGHAQVGQVWGLNQEIIPHAHPGLRCEQSTSWPGADQERTGCTGNSSRTQATEGRREGALCMHTSPVCSSVRSPS